MHFFILINFLFCSLYFYAYFIAHYLYFCYIKNEKGTESDSMPFSFINYRCCSFAQLSFNDTVLLKINFSGVESGSTLKYPKR